MARSVETILNESNPNKLPSGTQQVRLGRALRENSTRYAHGTVVTHVLALPTNEKAAQILDVYARAGAATGRFGVAAKESTPGAGFAAVDPLGDIEFAAADAVTDAEVVYVPVEGDLITEQIPVTAAGNGTLLQGKEAVLLIAASLDAGAVPGAKTVIARGSAPAAGQAAVTDAGQIDFNGADVGANPVTATVTYIAVPGVGSATACLGGRLAADSGT